MRCRLLASGLIALGLFASASAHELTDNRATLVLRDGKQITLTLYIGLSAALAATLAPEQPYQAFLVEYSSMPPAVFAQAYARAQASVQSSTKLKPTPEQGLSLQNWRWPTPVAAQDLIRQQIMLALTGGHQHETSSEISAEAIASKAVAALSLQLPAALQKVLVVAYQPTQRWLAPGEVSSPIKFERPD